jgi:hypothetical protein
MRLRGRAAVVVGGCALAWAGPAFAATPPTFADAARDAAAHAPELTTVVVSNDDAGTIRFRINVANQPRLGRDAALELFLDTDQNAATGDPLSLGADYRFVLDGASQSFEFARWNGTAFDPSAPSTTAAVRYWSGASISINRSELGDTSALAFWVRGTGPDHAADAAPNQGTWAYQLQVGSANPPDIEVFYFRVLPAAPRAGSTLQLRIDSIELVGIPGAAQADSWSCAATLSGKRLRGTGSGGCTFRLPKFARRKKLVVTMTVSYMGEVVTGTATYRVR